MSTRFDVIVVGSGFGGAIAARRVAEKGMRVLVLERGRRWEPDQYPRKPGDAWIFSDTNPARHNGWMEMRFFNRMTVAQAAGVGGGSLSYSSVAVEANPEVFAKGWPAEITYAELKPWYDIVAREMNLQVIPDGQLTRRFVLARDAARNLGYANRFSKAPLSVSFSDDWNYQLEDPFNPRHSRQFVNAHGQHQGTCIHLGNCDIGCDVRAKNSLDVNYIPRAEQHGADVRPLHLVRYIEPQADGYKVIFDRLENGRTIRGEESAERVVLGAGSLGTTELLLRCRDQYRTLPALSPTLGTRWSANANFISMGTYSEKDRVRQSAGPTIASLLDFTDGYFRNERFVVEDDGFPNLLLNVIKAYLGNGVRTPYGKHLLKEFEEYLRDDSPLRSLMIWLGAGKDAGDGELRLKRRWFMPWKRVLSLIWEVEHSKGVLDAMSEMHKSLTEASGGRPRALPTWSLFKSLLTLHPLGGCPMGVSSSTGVVDHLGRVFGYRNLIVADGAIVPTPTVRNPSHTIAALSERIAAHIS
ncbi:MAG: GMC family oxidoreductase [Vicinamibacterales bacterium]